MKRVFYLLALTAFVFSVSVATAADQKPAGTQKGFMQAQKSVNCCLEGKCKKAASAEICAKLGGKVVKDCKECK